MGSVAMLFIPLCLPFLSIIVIADKLGITVNDVIMSPFSFIINIFFSGDVDAFIEFLNSGTEKFLELFGENEEELVTASETIAKMLGNIF